MFGFDYTYKKTYQIVAKNDQVVTINLYGENVGAQMSHEQKTILLSIIPVG